MRHELYEMQYPDDAAEVLEDLRKRIAKVAGVTLMGNRLTIRWSPEGSDELVQVHAVILNVDDLRPEPCLLCSPLQNCDGGPDCEYVAQ